MRSPPQDEISHAVNAVSPQEDNLVDRLQVEAWQHVQLSSTNRTRAFPINDSSNKQILEIQRLLQAIYAVFKVYKFPWWFSDRITPVPIPNTAEKTAHSDNTRTVRSRKDSSLPRFIFKKAVNFILAAFFVSI